MKVFLTGASSGLGSALARRYAAEGAVLGLYARRVDSLQRLAGTLAPATCFVYAGDVRDASLYCPPGIEGVIVDVKIFSRKGQEKDERAKTIEAAQVAKLEKNLADEIRILTDERLKRLEAILGGKEVQTDLHDERTNKRLLTKGTMLDRDTIERISTRMGLDVVEPPMLFATGFILVFLTGAVERLPDDGVVGGGARRIERAR